MADYQELTLSSQSSLLQTKDDTQGHLMAMGSHLTNELRFDDIRHSPQKLPQTKPETDFSFLNRVPSPLQGQEDLLYAKRNAAHTRVTSDSLAKRAPMHQHVREHFPTEQETDNGSPISLFTDEEEAADLGCKIVTETAPLTTESALTYSESGYNPNGSLRQTTSNLRGSFPLPTNRLSGTGSIVSGGIPQRTTITSNSSFPVCAGRSEQDSFALSASTQ